MDIFLWISGAFFGVGLCHLIYRPIETRRKLRAFEEGANYD